MPQILIDKIIRNEHTYIKVSDESDVMVYAYYIKKDGEIILKFHPIYIFRNKELKDMWIGIYRNHLVGTNEKDFSKVINRYILQCNVIDQKV